MAEDISNANVFVISAPSATGKTTIIRRLIEENPTKVDIAISVTTRAMRTGERDGFDYRFVSKPEFEKRIAAGDMLEYANVHGNFYGSSKTEIKNIIAKGQTAVLIIDVQGWMNARKTLKAAKSIFIIPPNVDALWSRMEQRGTDSMETRWHRLQTAHHELEFAKHYDFFIVNDQLSSAVKEMQDIVIKGKKPKISHTDGIKKAADLLDKLHHAPWYIKLKQSYGT